MATNQSRQSNRGRTPAPRRRDRNRLTKPERLRRVMEYRRKLESVPRRPAV
jgi:hypothetical protein